MASLQWLMIMAAAPPANADEVPEYTFSSNIGVATDYISRGLRLNWNRPALQGGAEVVHRSGGYIGANFSQLTDQYYANGSVEVDLYVGLRQPFDDMLSYDVGLGAYFYPGANYRDAVPKGAYPDKRYDTVEAIFGISYRWLNLKYSRCLTDYYGYDDHTVPLSIWNSGVSGGVEPGKRTRGSGYYEANASFDIGHEVSVGLHIGRQVVTHSSKLSYSDYKISGTKTLPHDWSATVALSSTSGAEIYNDFISVNGNGQTLDIGGTHWVFSVNKAF
ncbi:TorF family putative porin [Sulfuricella denitrificans]|uniref:TorF family putative porin n=1 Tax=Sulfuricella denitrificans TaxID=649841 RepID=UPI001377A9CD|nr:TorF family putative porin [Sulfuricella denitrificans]